MPDWDSSVSGRSATVWTWWSGECEGEGEVGHSNCAGNGRDIGADSTEARVGQDLQRDFMLGLVERMEEAGVAGEGKDIWLWSTGR